MNANETAYKLGLEDGEVMARESGSTDAGVDGWDGMAINAVGVKGLVALFGLPEGTSQNDESFAAAMAEYCRGCQDGADFQMAALIENV